MEFHKLIGVLFLLLVLLTSLSGCGVGKKPAPSGADSNVAISPSQSAVASPSPSTAIAAPSSSTDSDRQMYAAYYEVAEEIVSKYGLFADSNAGPIGFVRGMLIDLDSDGKDEFLCFYGIDGEMHDRIAVYKYSNGTAVSLLDILSGNGFGRLDVGSGLSISKVDGKTYILNDDGSEFHSQHLYAYWLEDGAMKYHEFHADTETEDEDVENIVYKNCTIDSVSVSVEDYKAGYRKYFDEHEYYLQKPNGDDYTADDAQAFLESLKAMG